MPGGVEERGAEYLSGGDLVEPGIGEATTIGKGTVAIDHSTIGVHSVVGAGAVVTMDVPDHVLVVGMPARIVKENIAGK